MKVYVPGLEDVSETAKRMVALAKKTKGVVTAKFNGIALSAKPGDKPDTIVKYYLTEEKRRHEKCVESPKYKKQRQRAKKTQRRQDVMLKRALAAAPEKMTLRDKKGWKKTVAASTGAYDSEITSFAERWARLMEGRMAKGDTLKACAGKTSSLAGDKDLSGAMYNCAVLILSQVWIHGEQLRRWHNLKTQIGHEGEEANERGGVIISALLDRE